MLEEGTKIFCVFREDDAPLLDGKRKDLRVGKASKIEVMLDMFDVKVFIEPGELLTGRDLLIKEQFMFIKSLRHWFVLEEPASLLPRRLGGYALLCAGSDQRAALQG